MGVADIAVIGFGPVGAVLAGLLGKHGLRVVVIEKDEDVFPLPRAAHVDHTGLRTAQEIGSLDAISPTLVRNKRLDLVNADRRVLARIPADQKSVSGLPTSVYFYQPEFDAELRNAAARFPNVEIHLGTEMIGIDQGADEVALRVRSRQGVETTLHASWAVGCDGAWSPVREAMGIALHSLDFDEKWLVLDLLLNAPEPSLPVDHVVEVCDPKRPHLSTPISPNRQRFEFMLLPGENPEHMQQEHVAKGLLEPWLPASHYKIERTAVYTFHGLIAKQWRRGRVLIAGDAAHQTPPFLGQGMCAGIRDASNLAWKLERVIRHGAPVELLDTYEAERSPHARKVIEAAIRIGKVICELDPEKAKRRDERLLADDPAMREELAFALPRFEPGSLVLEGGGALFIQPVVGGVLLDDIVGSRFLVLARSKSALGASAAWWENEVGALVATLSDLDSPELHLWLDRYKADVVVVRPDRYVLGTAKTLGELTGRVEALLAPLSGARKLPAQEKAML